MSTEAWERAPLKRDPGPYETRALWGIMNPYGSLWTDQAFESPADAESYLRNFWKDISKASLSKFRIVLVRRSITLEVEDGHITVAPPRARIEQMKEITE